MKKPKKYNPPAAYKYSDIISYIEDKYKIKTRSYKKEKDGIYRDFWDWIYANCHSHLSKDGCYINLINEDLDYKKEVSEKDYINDKDADPSCTWGIEILQIILKEFPDLEESDKVWIEW
jgi:hypothetical protein